MIDIGSIVDYKWSPAEGGVLVLRVVARLSEEKYLVCVDPEYNSLTTMEIAKKKNNTIEFGLTASQLNSLCKPSKALPLVSKCSSIW